MGWGWMMAFLPHGEQLKEQRRLIARHFPASKIENYQPQGRMYARRVLRQLLETPDNFMDHIRHLVGAITISIAYGINVLPSNDPNINNANRAIAGGTEAGVPGAFLVDVLPILKCWNCLLLRRGKHLLVVSQNLRSVRVHLRTSIK